MVSCSPSHLVLVAVASQSQVAGGGGLQQETLPAQEGPGTEVAFSVPASVNPCISVPSKKGLYWMGSCRVGADTRHNGKAPSPIYGGKSVLWYLVGGNCS